MTMTFRPARAAFIFLVAVAALRAGSAVTSFDGTISEPSATRLALTQAEGSLAAGSIAFDLPS